MVRKIKELPDIYKFIITLLVAFGGFYALVSQEFVQPLNETTTRSKVNESNIKSFDGGFREHIKTQAIESQKLTASIEKVDAKVENLRNEQRASENRIIDKIMELQ